jgi:hypothetical protein
MRKAVVGLSMGKVMIQNAFQGPAPSTSAASLSSPGTFCSPAM